MIEQIIIGVTGVVAV